MIKASLIHEKSKNDEKMIIYAQILQNYQNHLHISNTQLLQMSEKLINTKMNSIKDRKFNFTLIIFISQRKMVSQ